MSILLCLISTSSSTAFRNVTNICYVNWLFLSWRENCVLVGALFVGCYDFVFSDKMCFVLLVEKSSSPYLLWAYPIVLYVPYLLSQEGRLSKGAELQILPGNLSCSGIPEHSPSWKYFRSHSWKCPAETEGIYVYIGYPQLDTA